MQRRIHVYPDDDCLRLRAREIDEITEEIKTLANDMVETMYSNQGLGLAAPQVGESLRLVTMDISGPDERTALVIMVNPRIVHQEGAVTLEEGCLSLPDYRTQVKRAEKVTVEFLDLDGRKQTLAGEELLAQCIQHELDHLDGKLFIDRISRLKRAMFEKKMRKQAKEKERNTKE